MRPTCLFICSRIKFYSFFFSIKKKEKEHIMRVLAILTAALAVASVCHAATVVRAVDGLMLSIATRQQPSSGMYAFSATAFAHRQVCRQVCCVRVCGVCVCVCVCMVMMGTMLVVE